MPFTLPPLPFPSNALEPHIDKIRWKFTMISITTLM